MFSTLQARIRAACLAIIALAMILASGINYLSVSSNFTQTQQTDLDAVIRSNVSGIEHWIATSRTMVEAARDHLDGDNPLPVLRQLADSGGFGMTYLAGSDGRMIPNNDWQPASGYDPRKRPWYQETVAADRTILTLPYIDLSTNELVVTVATPVKRNGQLIGVIGGDISIARVTASIAGIRPTPASYAFLFSGNETLIAHPDSSLVLQPLTRIDAALTPSHAKELTQADRWQPFQLGGQDTLLRVAPIGGSDWSLAVALDEHEANASLRAIIRSSFLTLLAVTLIAAVLLGALLKRSFSGLLHVRDAMEDIANGNGDLTRRLPAEGRDEVTQIANAFNSFATKIEQLLLDIRTSSQSIRQASDDIAHGSDELSSRTDATAANLQQASASMEELTGTVSHTAEASRQASQLSQGAVEIASQGSTTVAQMVQTMMEIDSASQQIADIVSVVDGLAFQTNLLALNASVEAARAGEQGRGFAVVAGEVRQLASRSADAAHQIRQLIDASTKKTRSGADLAHTVGETMEQVVNSVEQVASVLGEISGATLEQSQGIAQVNQAVAELDRMTQQNAALAGASTAAATQLRGEAESLTVAVGGFRLSDSTGNIAAAPLAPVTRANTAVQL